ncbi:MAG: AAA family ATPase [Cyanobacteria bacterium M_surface_7_m2_040]|nr:AAA family ATPase [Cyanobacteria bacterium K_Offshore_0m_m2_072]MBM5827206.1 AAA family ATPase [Cyanobacteria bacterium M_surface_7_m2_040]
MRPDLAPAIAALNRVLLGKEHQIRLALSCLVAGGHLLLEDLPGMGKTTLAEALARCCGLAFRRVHFTSDLLPADLTGIQVLDPTNGRFRFQPGPLFTQVLLADEINRASPRTQSALLEAMASGQVSVDGDTQPLPQPFVVIASQNGLDQSGTHPLPESQLDRFLMRLSLGFPDRAAEAAMLAGERAPLDSLDGLLSASQLLQAQAAAAAVPTNDALIAYVLDLLDASRQQRAEHPPLSPRAGLGLLAAARAWALLAGATFVTPAHVQAVFAAVAEHRLDAGRPDQRRGQLSATLLSQVDAVR